MNEEKLLKENRNFDKEKAANRDLYLECQSLASKW